MNTLSILGLASMAFVAAFTWRAYRAAPGAGQSPRGAIIEAWLNIAVGFAVNFTANWLILPMVGAAFTPGENFLMGWIYTAISMVRQYAIRRWFNAKLHAAAQRMAGLGGVGGQS
ncbi:hypothetical protein [Paucibacter sp. KBW04]|uniref:DUF7220 family protein n=1 Tax=Paucibacter sp. KBW04 TaxID=2153361 RepID=UPI001E2DB2AE|nr:hypothetical protein [Paucibacter sp. KBW04]